MKFILFLSLPVLISLHSCSDNNATVVNVPLDTTITPANAITDLYIDSIMLEEYIKSKGQEDENASLMRNFYKSRNYQYAWFTSSGMGQQAYAFWNLHNHFITYSGDSTLHTDKLHRSMDQLMGLDSTQRPSMRSRGVCMAVSCSNSPSDKVLPPRTNSHP